MSIPASAITNFQSAISGYLAQQLDTAGFLTSSGLDVSGASTWFAQNTGPLVTEFTSLALQSGIPQSSIPSSLLIQTYLNFAVIPQIPKTLAQFQGNTVQELTQFFENDVFTVDMLNQAFQQVTRKGKTAKGQIPAWLIWVLVILFIILIWWLLFYRPGQKAKESTISKEYLGKSIY